MKRFHMIILTLAFFLCVPGPLLAEKAKVEGTIQGLMSFCENKMCTPGEEMIIAAMEDTYVLVSEKGDYYLLPNLKQSQLSRHLGETVRVEGELKLNGRAIMVKKAEVREDGTWDMFYGPEILDRKQWFENFYLYGTP